MNQFDFEFFKNEWPAVFQVIGEKTGRNKGRFVITDTDTGDKIGTGYFDNLKGCYQIIHDGGVIAFSDYTN